MPEDRGEKMQLDLDGKRAVVTGASLGIGAATVRLLADMGAEVEFCARNKDAVEDLAAYQPSRDGSVNGHVADMGERQSVGEYMSQGSDRGNVWNLADSVGASPYRNFQNMSDE